MTAVTDPRELPIPAGAHRVAPWYHADTPVGSESHCGPGSLRYFTGREWRVSRGDPEDTVHVQLDGNQYADGRVERFVLLDGDPLTPQQAHELSVVLRAAADEAVLMALQEMNR